LNFTSELEFVERPGLIDVGPARDRDDRDEKDDRATPLTDDY
jgi:hypothetical protein